MAKQGYAKPFAAAVTATSATLGIIIPPSIPMVLYGVTTNTSIKDLFLAGIVPGIILAAGFMITSYIFAVKEQYPTDTKFEPSNLGLAIKEALIPLLVPLVVVGGLIGGFVTPTEASALGVIMILIYGKFFDDSLSLTKIYELAVQTIRQTSIVMMIVAGSSILGQFLANEQLPQQIAEALMVVTDSYVLKLILINAFLLILGMFLHAAAAIIVVVPILLPVAVGMGIDPVHFGVIVCLNLGVGQQTPPVASVLLTVCSATGLGVGEVMNYAKWFIVSMIVTLMIVSFMPWTALLFL